MNTFIAKILSLFFCCFVLGNAFAQDEITYKGKLEDKTTNQLLNFNDFTITVIETGEKVKVDSLGQFKFTLPKECKDFSFNLVGNDTSCTFGLKNLTSLQQLKLHIEESDIKLFIYLEGYITWISSPTTHPSVQAEFRNNIRNSNHLRGRYPITHFNKSGGN